MKLKSTGSIYCGLSYNGCDGLRTIVPTVLNLCLQEFLTASTADSSLDLTVLLAGDSHRGLIDSCNVDRNVAELDKFIVEIPITWPVCLALDKQRQADLNKVSFSVLSQSTLIPTS